ncbi:hypothetical protein Zmor_025015 [Zophobas morio]|uniref:Uncharacterized protein n=1 Tax=Zophobas morio TaxID=2755281 RepID=A0AA38HT32_9CUCU|nr:hypothetical protein Zmor_025015 [Zophobas morio]
MQSPLIEMAKEKNYSRVFSLLREIKGETALKWRSRCPRLNAGELNCPRGTTTLFPHIRTIARKCFEPMGGSFLPVVTEGGGPNRPRAEFVGTNYNEIYVLTKFLL